MYLGLDRKAKQRDTCLFYVGGYRQLTPDLCSTWRWYSGIKITVRGSVAGALGVGCVLRGLETGLL